MSSDTSDSIPLRSRLYVETSDYEDSVQSTSSEEITSSVEDSIEVQAPPLADEVGTVSGFYTHLRPISCGRGSWDVFSDGRVG
jgi:hypothetical protein